VHFFTGNSEQITMNAMRRFVLTVLLGLFFATAGAALTCFIVNPYGVFPGPGISGFNRDKTQAIWQPHLAKAYLVEHVEPATLLLGDSRIELGLNPQSMSWRNEFRPVFNLGVPGVSLSDQYRYFEHALSHFVPKELIIGSAFEDCFVWPDSKERDESATTENYLSRLRRNSADGARYVRFKDYVLALFSEDAFIDSVMTMLNQNDPDIPYMALDGWQSSHDFHHSFGTEGYHHLVMDKDRMVANTMLVAETLSKCDLGPLQSIIKLARSLDIKVAVILTPSYVDEFEIIKQAGLQRAYDNWKRSLVNIVSEAANGGDDVALWDFNRIDAYTTEPLPSPDDRSHALQWFWETKHFKAELGDQIINTLMDRGPTDFGVRLVPGNIEVEIIQGHDRLTAFESANGADVNRIRSLVSAIKNTWCAHNRVSCSILSPSAAILGPSVAIPPFGMHQF
jgi:hypothetical protein